MMHRVEMPLAVTWEIKFYSPNIIFPTKKDLGSLSIPFSKCCWFGALFEFALLNSLEKCLLIC